MIKYFYEARRIIRDQNFERWIYYKSTANDTIRQDNIIIFFLEFKIVAYVLTICPEDYKGDEVYITGIEGLFHDIGIMEEGLFDYDIELIKIPQELEDNDDDQLLDQYVENSINELKRKIGV